MKPLFGPVVLVLLLAWFGAAQVPDKITQDEASEVNLVAHQFADRMQETRDIKPLIREFFVRDFIGRSLRNSDKDWNDVRPSLDIKFARKMPRSVLERYFVAEMNWSYLGDLYLYSIASAGDDFMDQKLEENEDFAPLLIEMEKDPIMKFAFGASDRQLTEYLEDLPIRTKKRFYIQLRSYEKWVPIFRRHGIKIKAGTTPEWKETTDYWQARFEYYQPRLLDSDNLRYGMPPKTRLFEVTVPCFQLVMLKVGSRFKIVDAFPHSD